jgi:hypothetical protein
MSCAFRVSWILTGIGVTRLLYLSSFPSVASVTCGFKASACVKTAASTGLQFFIVGTPYCAVVCAGTSGNTSHTLLATSTLLLLLLPLIQLDTSAGIDDGCGCSSCAACWYLSGKHDGCTKTSKSSGYVPFVIKGVGARVWRDRCICCCRHTPRAVLTNAENADSALRYFLQATGRLHLPLASWPQISTTAIAEMSKASSACHQACAAPGIKGQQRVAATSCLQIV